MKWDPFWFLKNERVKFKLYSKSGLTFAWEEGIVNYRIHKSLTEKCYIVQMRKGGTISLNEDQLVHIEGEDCEQCIYLKGHRGVTCYHPDAECSFNCIQLDGTRLLLTKKS